MADFFIDPTNGNDSNDGLTVGNSFLTLAKYTTTDVRAAGDTATCRNGLSDNLGAADLAFDEDGNVGRPIIIKADYVDAFSDDITVTATGTFTFGSKAIILTADSTGEIAAEDVIYEATEDATEFSYQVASSIASFSGTDDGADSTKLIDASSLFGSTVLGTQIENTTDSITGYVSVLTSTTTVEVTLDGRPVANGGTVVVFDNGDTFTATHQAVLYLPYKGAQAGALRAITNIQSPPLWNTAAGDFQWDVNTDYWWFIQGIHLRGTDSVGIIKFSTITGWTLKDCVIEGNGAGDEGLKLQAAASELYGNKCRFFNLEEDIRTGNNSPWMLHFKDSLFDGNSVSNSTGLEGNSTISGEFEECEFRNHGTGDIENAAITSKGTNLKFRNPLMLSATQIDSHNLNATTAAVYTLEDFDGNINDFRQLTYLSPGEGNAITRSETTKVRVGGSTRSIKVAPSNTQRTGVNARTWSAQKLFEAQVYMEADAAKTFTIYFAADDKDDWDANPAADALWIEIEAWGDALFNHRKITRSTGTVNFDTSDFQTGSDIDQPLTVTVTPKKTGYAYLRGYWTGNKEAGNDNIFYCAQPGPGTIS